jgi:serine/threonine-protein kinase
MVAMIVPLARAVEGDVAAAAFKVFKQHCYECHRGTGSSSGEIFDVLKAETMTKPSEGDATVIAKDAEKSPLFDSIQKRMPKKGSPQRENFGDAERAAIKAWIDAGAPSFAVPPARKFRSLVDEMRSLRDTILKAREQDRRYLRFFTLANYHNDPARSEDDLRQLRAALSKAMNSLSWAPQIVLPQAVDDTGTLYVIDIRALDWERHRLWDKLAQAYPYGLSHRDRPERELRDIERDIDRYCQVQLPVMRADWFVASATRPPLYHDMLMLPTDARVLEKQLDVDIPHNFRVNKLKRAGFQKSGISEQNRLLERHDAKFGFYWKSYDFKADSAQSNLIRFPLGPDFANHPYPRQVFTHDGGEIIFGLPNGLQAYMLVDGKDQRINSGPIDVVADESRVSGTPDIVNGVSCIACHKEGMIPFKDFIRDYTALFGQKNEKVEDLYPLPEEFNKLVALDRDRFLVALEKACAPFLIPPGTKNPKEIVISKLTEPVGEVAKRYRRDPLTLNTIAAELYEPSGQVLLEQVSRNQLKQFGFGMLADPKGVIGRYQWEPRPKNGDSMMQEMARLLRYVPIK